MNYPEVLVPRPIDAMKHACCRGCLSDLLTFDDVPDGAQSIVAPVSSIWEPKQTIVIEFMDGPKEWHHFCMWTSGLLRANVNLVFKEYQEVPQDWIDKYPTFNSNIRITFEEGGSYSYVGTDNNRIPQDSHTMRLGWFEDFFEMGNDRGFGECRRVWLHELLHALGLHHGQHHFARPFDMSPRGYDELYAQRWTDDMIARTYTDRYDPQTNFFGAWTNQTLMIYYWPGPWATDGIGAPFIGREQQADILMLQQLYGVKEPGGSSVLLPIIFGGGR